VRWAALALVALTLTGCETTQEKAAKLEKIAKLQELQAAKRGVTKQRGLSITRLSTKVKVTAASLVHSSEGAAAVVTLRNSSASPLRNIPIAITVKDATGSPVYTNSTPGLSPALVAVPLLPAHAQLTWIDDQIQPSGTPVSVSTRVGEGEAVAGAIPRLSITGTHLIEDPTNGLGAEGSVVNHSSVGQQELVVYAVARRAGRIVAAGRAILAQAPAETATRFQIFFIGDPRGAALEVNAPAATDG
jgi:hypothetical protein